jgi:hypothetical protein
MGYTCPAEVCSSVLNAGTGCQVRNLRMADFEASARPVRGFPDGTLTGGVNEKQGLAHGADYGSIRLQRSRLEPRPDLLDDESRGARTEIGAFRQ